MTETAVLRVATPSAMERLIDTQAQLRTALQKVTVLLNNLNELQGVDDRRRRIYSGDSLRDESGRVLGKCEICHVEGVVLVGLGRCRTCYGRLYRHRHPRRERLGGAPLVSLVTPPIRGI